MLKLKVSVKKNKLTVAAEGLVNMSQHGLLVTFLVLEIPSSARTDICRIVLRKRLLNVERRFSGLYLNLENLCFVRRV